ncbi:hypothetical protein PIIN_04284, partial [Serendipita indica DSM 11827]
SSICVDDPQYEDPLPLPKLIGKETVNFGYGISLNPQRTDRRADDSLLINRDIGLMLATVHKVARLHQQIYPNCARYRVAVIILGLSKQLTLVSDNGDGKGSERHSNSSRDKSQVKVVPHTTVWMFVPHAILNGSKCNIGSQVFS